MDRRLYRRITINAEGVFILDNNEISHREFPGVIEDISEGGIKIKMVKDEADHILPHLKTGSYLHFLATDDYTLFGNVNSAIISGQVEVLRQDTINNLITLGCKFKKYTSELLDYVSDRKLSIYVDGLRGTT